MSRKDSHIDDLLQWREDYTTAIAKSQPAWDTMTAHAHSGSPYNVSEKELQVLQDPSFGPESPGWRHLPARVPLTQAHEALRHANGRRPTWAQYAARKRLFDAYSSSHGSRTPGLVIKMVNDIDTVLFDGTLRNRILVHWVDYSVYKRKLRAITEKGREKEKGPPEDDETPVATTVVPPECFRNTVRPAIYISAEAICYASQSRVSLIALFIHEMLHAYLAIVTHGEDEATAAQGDDEAFREAAVDHGPLFEASCDMLAVRLGFRGLGGRDICWYHRSPRSLVHLRDADKRKKVRLRDGLMHYVLP